MLRVKNFTVQKLQHVVYKEEILESITGIAELLQTLRPTPV